MAPTFHDYVQWLVIRGSKIGAARYRPSSGGQSGPEAFYDDHFRKRHLELFALDIRSQLRREQVQQALATLPAGSAVLDLGCGVGHMIHALRPDCRRIGVDVSMNSLQLARSASDDILYVQSSAYALPFSDASLDAIVCLEVIEHLEDDGAALNEFQRVLKPGGQLVASVPNSHYFPSYLRLMGHYRHYRVETMRRLFSTHGFDWEQGLNEYPILNRRYLYIYVPLRVAAVISSAMQGQYRSVYLLRLPFQRRPLYEQLLPLMRRWSRADELWANSHSTFAAFRRRA